MVNDDDMLLFIQTTVRTITLRKMMITLWTMMTNTGCTMTITNNTIFLSHFRILRLLWTLSVSLVDVES